MRRLMVYAFLMFASRLVSVSLRGTSELNLATEALDVDAGRELGEENLNHHPPAQSRLLGHKYA